VGGEACGCAKEDTELCGQGSFCQTEPDTEGACAPCEVGEHCGAGCEPCEGDTPVCLPGETVADARCVCNDTSCGAYHRCNESGSCKACGHTADACGPACADCTAGLNTPYCDTGRAEPACVQCLTDDHCREAPVSSSLGSCTEDRTCTCVVEEEKWECNDQSDCPEGTYCARDAENYIDPDTYEHYACLAACVTPGDPRSGLACEERPTRSDGPRPVWAPMTSCYAFWRFGADCEHDVGGAPDPNKCRLSFELDDGTCVQVGASDYRCTYSCWDDTSGQGEDSWCPNNSCDIQYCNVP
jgi:hypothetical protein